MSFQKGFKFQSLVEFWEYLPQEERIIADVLFHLIKNEIGDHYKVNLAYNVPYFYGKRRICMIWPASIPYGGVKKGVLLGFSYGNKLKDVNAYLTHGTNKQVFYKIFYTADEIDEKEIRLLLKEAIELDRRMNK